MNHQQDLFEQETLQRRKEQERERRANKTVEERESQLARCWKSGSARVQRVAGNKTAE